MVKKVATQTMKQFLASLNDNINVEPHLDVKIVEQNGFFRRAVTTAGLWNFVTARPTAILAPHVAQFLLNLKPGHTSSTITDPDDGELVEVDLARVADAFNLPKEGVNALSDLELSVDVEFARFAADKNAEFRDKGSNMRTDLEKPYNLICELYTKSVVCSVGTLGQMSDTKIFAVSVIVDSLTRTKFNWHSWFINQLHDVAKDFEYEEGSIEEIVQKGKLRFFAKLSFALEQIFSNRRWTNTEKYKKNTIFYDIYKTNKILVDRGILQVEVRPAVPIAERQVQGSKRAASPAKRAAPKRAKKVKRVASLIEAGEEEEQPRAKEVEIDQPQLSPAKTQTIPQPSTAQIQTHQPQEPLTSTTEQPQTQRQPQTSTHSLYEEESASSIPIPKLPFLQTDLEAAFTLYEPIQQQTTQAPTQAQTIQACTPNSPNKTVDTTQTAHTEITIKPPTKPPPPTAEEKALRRYIADRKLAHRHFRKILLP